MKNRIIPIILAFSLLFSLATIPVSANTEKPPLSTADALQILRHAAEIIVLSQEDQIRFDFFGDGMITTRNALFALRVAAGIIDINGNLIVSTPVSAGTLRVSATSTEIGTFRHVTLRTNYSDVTWTSSDPTIATVTKNYRETGNEQFGWGAGVDSSYKEGTTTITGRRPNGNTVAVTITVKNTNPLNFNPADFPNLALPPVPVTPDYNPFSGTTTPAVTEYYRVRDEFSVWMAINDARILDGLNPQNWDVALAEAARTHALDLNANNIRSHIGSDNSTHTTRAVRAGFQYDQSLVREAIAFNGANRAIQDWLNSPSHKSIMMSSGRDLIGIGVDGGTVVLKTGAAIY